MLLTYVWKNKNLVYELTKREVFGRYKGSFGGIIWALLHPLFLLSVYTIAFGVILKTRWGFSGGVSDYALILFAGLIIFNVFSEVLLKSPTLITAHPNFVKKIVFPLELLPLVVVISALIHGLVSVLVWIAAYIIFFHSIQPTILLFPVVLICLTPLLLGVGWLLSSIGVIVKDLNQVAGMINHAMLFLTPIFYSSEAAPELLQHLLILNPLTFIVEKFRLVMFYGQPLAIKPLILYFAIATIFALLSLSIFKRIRIYFAEFV